VIRQQNCSRRPLLVCRPLSHNDVASTGGLITGAIHDQDHNEAFRSRSCTHCILACRATVAENVVAWVSSTGSNSNPCTAALPCATFFQAINSIGAGLNGQVNCLNSFGTAEPDLEFGNSVTIDCAGVYETSQPNEGAFIPVGTGHLDRRGEGFAHIAR
jgi:hypothetical protein